MAEVALTDDPLNKPGEWKIKNANNLWRIGGPNKKGKINKIFPLSGGEENRTPVQTYSSKAFYMFIC
jgi:hypothetical protein